MKRLLLFFCCLGITGVAQEASLQDLVNKKQYVKVIEMADNLTPQDSADYGVMYAIGQAYEGVLRYRDAYEFYRHCLLMDTANIDMLNTAARMATQLGRAAEASDYFHRVLQNDSTNFYATYQLARLNQQLGDYEKAIQIYTKLNETNPDNTTIHRNIAECFTRMEEYQLAALHYFLAYSSNRENAGLASSLVNTLLRNGDDGSLSDALHICDTALYYNPNNRQLLRNKGMALYMNKKYADADTLYTKLMLAGDSTYLTLKYGGASRYYAGQFMNSIDPLEMAFNMDTTAVDVCLLLGSAYGKTYDKKRALSLLDKAEEEMKPHPFLSNQLLMFRAETFKTLQRYDESAALYYQAYLDDPNKKQLLGYISNLYSAAHISQFDNERKKQKAIFARIKYIENLINDGKQNSEGITYHRYFLESIYEDMFFRSVTEQAMLAPDGKKSMLNIMDLRSIINQLPEMEENEKKTLDELMDRNKARKKEEQEKAKV